MTLKPRTAAGCAKLALQCTRTSLKRRIDTLLEEAAPLSLVPTEIFSDIFSLVAHLKVAGTQRNFPTETKFSVMKGLRLNCTAIRTSNKCSAGFLLEEMEDGSSRLVSARLSHNQPINRSLEIDEGIKGVTEWRRPDGEGIITFMNGENEVDDFDSKDHVDVEERDVPKSSITPPNLLDSNTRIEFRSYYSIKPDIARLVQGPKIILPTWENAISIKTHDEFRIQAVASAIQDNYLLHLDAAAFDYNPNKFKMKCSRNNSSCISKARCYFFMNVIVDFIKDGEKYWKVQLESEHNQLCFNLRRRDSTVVDSLPIASTSTLSTVKRSAAPLAPPATHKHIHKRPRISPASHPLTSSLPVNPIQSTSKTSKSERTIPTNHFTSISISQLSNFLYHLSPSLSIYANVLYHQGQIQTVETLIDLISMSSINLDYFLDQLGEYVGENGMRSLQRITFKNKLVEISRGSRRVR